VPETVGENVTVTVQLLPAAIDEAQVGGFGDAAIVTPLFVTAVVPVLATVTDIPALVVPVGCCGT